MTTSATPTPALGLAARGPLEALDPGARRALLARGSVASADLAAPVATILARVRAEGDDALRAFAHEFDGVTLGALEVPPVELRRALETLPAQLRSAMERAHDAIARVHAAFRPRAERVNPAPGVWVTRRPDPLARVGVYAPGGRASYPSSVLMGVTPARIAGVGEVVVCSPPARDGRPATTVLAAAALAGADRVFALGGAGAVAALAYGTGSVPRVDRIVGPGNAWVTEAKRQLAGTVGIDTPAGPSELLVIADAGASAESIAREMVAQAEHDPDAAVVALALDTTLAAAIEHALAAAVATTPRRAIVTQALAAHGAVLTVATRDAAAAFASEYAPEHLQIVTADASAVAATIRGAGTVFLGAASSVTFGDYRTGANHVLPTGGLGRAWSGLSTLDFVRWTTVQSVTPAAAAAMADDAATLAEAEGLPAHAAAARAWRSTVPETSEPCFDLSDNTDRFGDAAVALDALSECDADDVTRYPSERGEPLIAALAARYRVPPAEIVTGCGSDDVLDLAFRTLAVPGARVAFPDPTFSMVHAFTTHAGLTPVPVPCQAAGRPDVDGLIRARAAFVYLCSPNNPTGGAVREDEVARLLRDSDAFVIVDEAYAEFLDDDAPDHVRRHPRLLVTRTFSKAYGLAGLRVGYGIGPEQVIVAMTRRRGPYRVSRVSERAAIAAFASRDAMGARVRAARSARAELTGNLVALGLTPLPSDANFVLLPVRDAAHAMDAFACAGVTVRGFAALTGIGDAVRITVGPPETMARVLEAAGRLAGESR